MPTIPDTVPSRAVHIHIVGGAGGHVFLKSPALFDASGALILPATRWRATLDVSDEATITVPCTDTDTISPVGWAYKVTTSIAGVAPMGSLQVPAGGAALEFATAIQVGTPPAPAASYTTLAAHNAAVDTLEAADTAEATARAAADSTLATGLDTLNTAIVGPGGVGERLTAIEGGTATLGTVNTTNGATFGGLNFFEAVKIGGAFSYPGPPLTGTWEVGMLTVDSNARWWRCSVAGTPGTWVTAS